MLTLAAKDHPRPFTLPHTAASTVPWSPPQTGRQALCLCSPGQICCAGVKKTEQSEVCISFPVRFPGLVGAVVQPVTLIKHSLWSVPKADSSQLQLTAGSYRTDHSHVLKKIGTLQKPEQKNAVTFFFLKKIKLMFSSNSYEEHFRHMKS